MEQLLAWPPSPGGSSDLLRSIRLEHLATVLALHPAMNPIGPFLRGPLVWAQVLLLLGEVLHVGIARQVLAERLVRQPLEEAALLAPFHPTPPEQPIRISICL